MEKFLDIGLDNDFLKMTPKVQATRGKRMKRNYNKVKIFCTALGIINKMNDNI